MNNISKRIVSLLMALVLMLSVVYIPDVVYAEDAAAPIEIAGGGTITAGGTYHLTTGTTGAVTISTTDAVTILGDGFEVDASQQYVASKVYSNVNFVCSAAGANLTLRDMIVSLKKAGANLIDFTGLGNKLNIEGTVVLDYDVGYTSASDSVLHVGPGTSLTIGGSGTYYQYNCTQGAGIGGTTGEMNGDITFAMTGCAFIKGTRQGAVIGAGARANGTGTPGTITFLSGTYNLETNSRGACIGGSAGSGGASAGTAVYIKGGNININQDFSGPAIGGGGYDSGSDASGGTVYITGGSLRTYVDKNAASNIASTQYYKNNALVNGVNNAGMTALRKNANNEDVYLCVVDTTGIAADKNGQYTVKLDGSETAFYQGGLPEYGFVNEQLDKGTGEQIQITSTVSNWYKNGETRLFLYLTGADHTIDVNGTKLKATYNASALNTQDECSGGMFTVGCAEHQWTTGEDGKLYCSVCGMEKTYKVTFNVTPGDANIYVSEGMICTYTEKSYTGVPTENGVEFMLPAGKYNAAITKDGYYGSSFAFEVTETVRTAADQGTCFVQTTTSGNNVTSYLSKDVFTIPLTKATYSTNPGAWDGRTLDVSWYNETDNTFYIKNGEQLAGMAAIVNGIYNTEITTIKDDADGDGTVETYTPAAYARLANRKIRASLGTGATGANNLVTTNDYVYGTKSTGTYINSSGGEMMLPADFSGKTIYLTADIDMGGVYDAATDTWSGARYMPIGGQYLMYYIDYSKWYSDGLTHLSSSFNGHFEGQGHIIYNMYCDRYAAGSNFGDSQSVGIIGRMGNHDGDPASIAVATPSVRNVAAAGYVYARRSVGGIVGKTGQTLSTRGGATGWGDSTIPGPTIENCVNFCNILSTDSKGTGGIIGAGWNKCIIRSCANFGSVKAQYKNGGGICGSFEGTAANCYNVGDITKSAANNGQAFGTNNGGANVYNFYWLTGTSNTAAPRDAIWNVSSTSTTYEVTDNYDGTTMTAAEYMQTAAFAAKINGTTSRAFVQAKSTDAIYTFLKAAGYPGAPVPRCFTVDSTTLTSIELVSNPTKTDYVEGQKFDSTGLIIRANWSDGTSEVLNDLTYSITRELAMSDTEVVVTATVGTTIKSFTVPITVVANSLDSIKTSTAPSKRNYNEGDTLDLTNMKVLITYTNGTTATAVWNAEQGKFVDSADATKAYDTIKLSLVDGETVTPVGYTDAVSVALHEKALTVSYTYTDGVTKDYSNSNHSYRVISKANKPAEVEGVYQVSTADELDWVTAQVNYNLNSAINFVLTEDIAANDGFRGIATQSSMTYTGTFDGQGHSVTVAISGYPGLFGFIKDATVKNVTVKGSVVHSYASYGAGDGGVVGTAKGASIVDNCANEASVTGKGYYLGGVVGYAEGTTKISNCTNYGTVTFNNSNSSNYYTGGVVGCIKGTASVTNCVNNAAVTSPSGYIGGVVGTMYEKGTTLTNCANHGSVTGTGTYSVGGVVGKMNAAATATNLYNTGAITGNCKGQNGVGGIIGGANSGAATVKNMYNAGKVTNNSTDALANTGSIAGYVYLSGSYNNSSNYSNYYWLDGTAEHAFKAGNGWGNDTVTLVSVQTGKMTADDMKATSFAGTLGTAFKAATCGTPLLTWEQDNTGHTLTHHDAVAPGCKTNGNIEYWSCDACGKYFSDAAAATEITADSVTLRGTGHKWTDATYEWTQTETGYTCTGSVYCQNEGCTVYPQTTPMTETVTATYEVTKAATCTEDGTGVYTAVFGNNKIAAATKEVVIPATGHKLTKTAAKAATCTTAGNSAYYTCSACHKYFKDAKGVTEIAKNSWVVKAKGHSYKATVVKPTYDAQGYTLHKCSVCGKSYKDTYTAKLTLKAPTVKISTNATSGKPTLTWAKVTGASKYYVYRATSKSGTYYKMATVTGTSYTNTSAKPGTTYYYKVKAVTAAGTTSAYSTVKSITCDCAAPVVSITTSSGKPKLTWKKVDGATSYVVYRSTSKTGTYTKLTSTTGTAVTNSSAKKGTTYYYKVKALCSKSSYATSAFSSVKSIKATK